MVKVKKPGFFNKHVTLIAEKGEAGLDALDDSLVEALFKEHGALLFRGFNMDQEGFVAFTQRFCTHSVFNESGGRRILDSKKNLQTVNLGSDPFPLHPELSREPWKPDVCFFGCLTPPTKGGETLVCDGTKMVQSMPKKIRAALEQRRLMYRRLATPEELRYWLEREPGNLSAEDLQDTPEDCPFKFGYNAEGKIYREFTAPFLHRTMFGDELAFGNFLLFSRYHNKVKDLPLFEDRTQISDELADLMQRLGLMHSRAVKWKKGDLLMVDNSRFLHGRKAITDPDNRLILTYFGYLKFAKPSEEEGPNPRWRDPQKWAEQIKCFGDMAA